MRFFTHQIAAIGIAHTLSLPFAGFLGSLLGAVLPDLIDQFRSSLFSHSIRHQKQRFAKIHRGISHWFGLYAGLFFLPPGYLPNTLEAFLTGLFYGTVSHIVLDMLTPKGVPILPFVRNLSLPLCSTGSLGEYLFLLALLALFIFLSPNDLLSLLRDLPSFWQKI